MLGNAHSGLGFKQWEQELQLGRLREGSDGDAVLHSTWQ